MLNVFVNLLRFTHRATGVSGSVRGEYPSHRVVPSPAKPALAALLLCLGTFFSAMSVHAIEQTYQLRDGNSCTVTVSGTPASVANGNIVLVGGCTYTITITATAGPGWEVTKPKPNPLTFTLTVPVGVTSVALGYAEFKEMEGAEAIIGTSVTATVVNVDLDIDSDNNGGVFGGPDGSLAEDKIELKAPGKYIPLNDGDIDNDDVPNFADGFDKWGNEGSGAGGSFTPIVLEIPDPIDLSVAKVKFTYSCSDPAGVTRTGEGTATDPYVYQSAAGNLRIWKVDGSASRSMAEVNYGGDFVKTGSEYTPSELGSGRVITLYVEGINRSAALGDLTIKVEVNPDPSQGYVCPDTVCCTVINIDLDIDSDNNNALNPPERSPAEDEIEDNPKKPGKYVMVNNGDSDGDGIPGFADGFNWDGTAGNLDDISASNHFTPIVLEIPEPVNLAKARLRFNYSGSDPAKVTRTGKGTSAEPYVYTPAPGALRIWKKDGNATRNKLSCAVSTLGDYVPSQEYTDLSKLGLSGSTRTVTFYVEGISKSAAFGDQEIKVELDPDGATGPAEWVEMDAVRCTVFNIDIGMDGNRDGAIDFRNPADAKYLFWVNDDYDTKHWEEEEWHEDDIQLYTFDKPDFDDDSIGRKGNKSPGYPKAEDYSCRRDLEDFTHLHICIDGILSSQSGISYWLKSEGGVVNLFEAVDETFGYLENGVIADQQIKKPRLVTVAAGTDVEILGKYILSGGQISPFLLEGKTAGKGALFIIVKKDGKEIGRKSVGLDLRPITEFYEKYVVSTTAGDNVAATGTQTDTCTYKPDVGQYFLFVHGWNMTQDEKDNWDATVFKRLWWHGYKGHIGSFQWPTYVDHTWNFGLTFDPSELRAWRSAPALKDLLTKLNTTYPGNVNILAHSMGNIVTGEALNTLPSNTIHAYIAAQAAISARFYDNDISDANMSLPVIGAVATTTPDVIGHYFSGQVPDGPYLGAVTSHAQVMALYVNADDYALNLWNTNNCLKPDVGYHYNGGTDAYNRNRGDMFYLREGLNMALRELLFPQDRFEVFARCVQSRSRALGTESQVVGFGIVKNLQAWGYNERHYSHSREFRSNIVDEWPFWSSVMTDAGLASTKSQP